eukprot:TRINITY_DN471_c0_g1_i1.p1 TRINITY_DN471_c0_g1~~TRINITY_DN471_c0_g1_i1.p1  ORF type:complete len:209 (-),score=44.39 TRINITY_DN471_c0_g1_i1:281-907(-)
MKNSVVGHLLGYGVIIGSSLSKLPQIIRVVNEQSVRGLSLPMFSIELSSQVLTTLYHIQAQHSFSAYGENVTFGVSNLIVLYYFAKLSSRIGTFFSCCAAGAALSRVLSKSNSGLLTRLYGMTIIFYIASRLPQIISNFNNKDTGVLSVTTFAASLLGSLIRLKSSRDLKDNMMLLSMVVSIVCNTIIISQILYYKKSDKAVKTTKPQ